MWVFIRNESRDAQTLEQLDDVAIEQARCRGRAAGYVR